MGSYFERHGTYRLSHAVNDLRHNRPEFRDGIDAVLYGRHPEYIGEGTIVESTYQYRFFVDAHESVQVRITKVEAESTIDPDVEQFGRDVERLIAFSLILKLDGCLPNKTADIRLGMIAMQNELELGDDIYKGAVVTVAKAINAEVCVESMDIPSLEAMIDTFSRDQRESFWNITIAMQNAQNIARAIVGKAPINHLATEIAIAMHGERWTRTGESPAVSQAEIDTWDAMLKAKALMGGNDDAR